MSANRRAVNVGPSGLGRAERRGTLAAAARRGRRDGLPKDDAVACIGDLPLHLPWREPVNVELDANGPTAASDLVVTCLEGRGEVTARPDDPRQLVKRLWPIRRRKIHERVPAHDTGERGILERKTPHVGDVEGNLGVVPTRDADHLRGQVDAVRFQSAASEIGGQPPWAAPDVTDRRPNAVLEKQIAEQAEHGSLDGHLIENVGKLVSVQLGKSIMRVAQLFSRRVHADRLARPNPKSSDLGGRILGLTCPNGC